MSKSSTTSKTLNIQDFEFYGSIALFKIKNEEEIKKETGTNLKEHINQLFINISENAKTHLCKIHDKTFDENTNYYFCAFIKESTPRCIKNMTNKEKQKKIYEQVLAYILIIRYKDYITICSKDILYNSLIKSCLIQIPHASFSNSFIPEDFYFKKVSLKNLDVSDQALRSQILEAEDLNYNLTDSMTNNYMVASFRGKSANNRDTISINPVTSKIQKYFRWYSFNEIIKESKELINKAIKHNSPSNLFFNKFAKIIDCPGDSFDPTYIHFMAYEFLNYFEMNKNLYLQKGNKTIDKKTLNDIYEKLTALCYLKDNEELKLEKKENRYKIKKISDYEKYTIKDESGSKLGTLVDLVNEKQWFILCSDQLRIRYYNGQFFENTDLLTDYEIFEDLFKKSKMPFDFTITSEKGYNNFSEEDSIEKLKFNTSFPEESEFHFVEKYFSDSSYLICDDLNAEFADFISINKEKKNISFIHCKSKEKKERETIASVKDFEEVVAQAIKNIGTMTSFDEFIEQRKAKWDSNYPNTKIKRLRPTKENNNPDIEDVISALKKIRMHPNGSKDIYLVINFLTKETFLSHMQKLESDKTTENSIVRFQLLWLLNSLVSVCRQQNIKVHILYDE